MDWYYAREGQRLGPVPEDRLRELIAGGEVRPDDLVWRAGFPDWRPAREAPDLFPAALAAPPLPGAGGPALPVRWLSAYTVIIAVLGGLNILSALAQLPVGGAGRVPVVPALWAWLPGLLSLFVAWGLWHRRRWAWHVNFWLYLVAPLVVGALVFVAVSVALLAMEEWRRSMGYAPGPAIVALAVGLGIFALWPALNLVYFRKRRHLFT